MSQGRGLDASVAVFGLSVRFSFLIDA